MEYDLSGLQLLKVIFVVEDVSSMHSVVPDVPRTVGIIYKTWKGIILRPERKMRSPFLTFTFFFFLVTCLSDCLWIQMQLWRDGKLPEVNPVFFVSLLLIFSKLGNIILWGTRWCCWDFWYGLSFFWLYWGIIDKSCMYLIYVHDVMYNVMAWHTYALWNSYHNHFTMRWFT